MPIAIPVEVTSSDQLYTALKTAKDGDVIHIAPGVYTAPSAGPFKAKGVPNLQVIGDAGSGTIIRGGYDGLTIEGCANATVQNIHTREAGRGGFYFVSSDNLKCLNCSGVRHTTWGALTSKCHYLYFDGFYGAESVNQHGLYISNHGMQPTVVNSLFERNGRCGLQFNADRSQALPPVYFGQGQINDAVVRNVECIDNCVTGVGASMNVLGCWNATIENVKATGGKAGGINFSNDDNLTPEGLAYGSRNCTLKSVEVSGIRGISAKSGSFGLKMIDVRVDATGGPCLEWDQYSKGWSIEMTGWTCGTNKKRFYGPSYQSNDAPEDVLLALTGTHGKAPL